MQLLEAGNKFIYILHLKAFLFNLNNGSLLKYIYAFSESHFIAHNLKPRIVICRIRRFSNGKSRYFLVSLLSFIYVVGCHIYIGVNCS
jgi:hypothetical protein